MFIFLMALAGVLNLLIYLYGGKNWFNMLAVGWCMATIVAYIFGIG